MKLKKPEMIYRPEWQIEKKLKKPEMIYRPDWQIEKEFDIDTMADSDYYHIKDLIKQGREDEVADFVNDRMRNLELTRANYGDKTRSAGMPTKEYAEYMVGKDLFRENPDIEEYLMGGNFKEAVERLEKVLHPNYRLYRKKAYEKAPILEKIFPGMMGTGFNPYIDPASEDDIFKKKPAKGFFTPSKGIHLSLMQSPTSYASTLKHEMDHGLDHTAKYLSDDPDFIKEYPKYKNFKNSNYESKEEIEHVNPVIPNFEDYDFEKGEFRSNYAREPMDIAQEATGGHRYGRDFLFEELRGKLKGKK